MRLIQELSEMIEEEIEDAEKYARCALSNKEERVSLSKMFYQLSEDEMAHMKRLHEAVVNLIETYRVNHGDPPADMMAVYEYLHKKHIDAAEHVRMYQQMYKES